MSKKGLYIGGHRKEYGSPKMGYFGNDPFGHLKQGSPMKKARKAAKKKAVTKARTSKKQEDGCRHEDSRMAEGKLSHYLMPDDVQTTAFGDDISVRPG